MVFFAALAVGALFVFIAVRLGFYAAWILCVNLLLSVYVAVFATPYLIAMIPIVTEVPGGYGLVLLCAAVATLAITYGICYGCLSGQFFVEFPKILDTATAGILGFLAGFLLFSFLAFAICLTPLADLEPCPTLGLNWSPKRPTDSYLCWCCDNVHAFLGASGVNVTSKQVLDGLLKRAGVIKPPPPPVVTNKPTAPPKTVETPIVEESAEVVQPEDALATELKQLERELAAKRTIINDPTNDGLAVVLRDPKFRIIEIAPSCTADKFNPEQIKLLKAWVAARGTLWVSNNVLGLFGIPFVPLPREIDRMHCVLSSQPAASEMFNDCRKVVLKEVGGKACIVPVPGILPLLVPEDTPTGLSAQSAMASWSLVRYGQGCISDAKPIDLTQKQGREYWRTFCKFSLRKIQGPTTLKDFAAIEAAAKKTVETITLQGKWEGSESQLFKIRHIDNEITVQLEKETGKTIYDLNGKMTPSEKSDRMFEGTFHVKFNFDPPDAPYFTIPFTATLGKYKGQPQLIFMCSDWPMRDDQNRVIGKQPITERWLQISGPAMVGK